MLPCSEKWDHYLTGTFYGLLSVFRVVGGREAARALWVTHKKIIPVWQEKLPFGNLKTVSWPHVVAEDPVMLFVRTKSARAALMSGKIWRIIFFFPLCIPSWTWMGRVEEGDPGKARYKPHSWGQSGGLLYVTSRDAISALRRSSERLRFLLACVRHCNWPFSGGPWAKGCRWLWWWAS